MKLADGNAPFVMVAPVKQAVSKVADPDNAKLPSADEVRYALRAAAKPVAPGRGLTVDLSSFPRTYVRASILRRARLVPR